MKHLLRLEFIGADQAKMIHHLRRLFGHDEAAYKELSRRPWVAEIAGTDGRFWFNRQFIKPAIDYSEANGIGSRGVMYTYFVEDGHVYEIKRWDSWRSSRRYFARWEDCREIEMSKEEVEAWVSSVASAKMF